MVNIINVGNRIMNTYVYNTAEGYIMVDTGYEHSLTSVVKKLKKHCIDLSDIKYVFLTHAHDDHAGFLNELLDKNYELKVILCGEAISTLKRGQNSFEGGCSTILAWIFCKCMAVVGKAEHRFPCVEDRFDNRFIQVSDANINELEELLQGEILFTPGHTKDSISLKKDNMIFCGDVAMNGFPSVKRLIIWVEDKEQLLRSWETIINEEKLAYIYPAHGKPFKKNDLLKYKQIIHQLRLYPLKRKIN